MSNVRKSSAYRGFLFLFALAISVLSLSFVSTPAIAGPALSGPADFPSINPGDAGTVIDLREGYGLSAVATSVTGDATVTEAVGSIAATGAAAPAVLVATGIGYGLYKEWKYFHPQAATYVPPAPDTDYGGGYWSDGNGFCDASDNGKYYQDGCIVSYNGRNVTMIMETAVAASATNGTIKLEYVNNNSTAQTAGPRLHCQDYPYSGAEASPESLNGQTGISSLTLAAYGTVTAIFDASQCANPSGNLSGGALSVGDYRGSIGGVSYVFGGTPSYPTDTPTTSTVTPNITCSDNTTVSGSPVTYDTGSTDAVDLAMPTCPSGTIPTGITVNDPLATGSDSNAPDQGVSIGWTAPSTWTNPSASPYPNCLPGGANAPCVMRLGVLTATGILTCGDQFDCTTYTVQDPSSTATQVTEPDGNTYECEYGPYQIAVSSCDSLGDQEGTTTTTEEGDEPTGSPVLGIPPIPDSGCFPHGWGMLNPVSWVEDPVKCALKWAFVPSQSVSARLENLRDTAESKPPLDIITTGLDFFGACLGNAPSSPIATGTTSNPDQGFPIPADVPDAKDYLSEQPTSGHWQLFQGVGDWMQGDGHFIYLLGQVAIVAGFCWYAWERITASTGSKEVEEV